MLQLQKSWSFPPGLSIAHIRAHTQVGIAVSPKPCQNFHGCKSTFASRHLGNKRTSDLGQRPNEPVDTWAVDRITWVDPAWPATYYSFQFISCVLFPHKCFIYTNSWSEVRTGPRERSEVFRSYYCYSSTAKIEILLFGLQKDQKNTTILGKVLSRTLAAAAPLVCAGGGGCQKSLASYRMTYTAATSAHT